MEGHPFRRLIYKNPLSKFLTAHLSIGDILSEAFSGVWMASVSTGLMFSFSDPNSSYALLFTVIIALSVNATWGLIDGWTSIYGSKVNEADGDRILRRLWSRPIRCEGERDGSMTTSPLALDAILINLEDRR